MYRSAIRLISNWTSWSLVHWQHGLVLGFGTLLLLIAFVSAISLEAIKDTELDLRKIVDVQFQKLVLTKKMNTAARERTTSITKLMYLDDPFDRDEELMRFHSAAADFIAARRAFQAMDLDTTERQLIEETLAQHDWRIADSAAALGISRKNLWEKMRKHGLQREEE